MWLRVAVTHAWGPGGGSAPRLSPRCLPPAQQNAASVVGPTRTEPASAWMGTSAPPASAGWVWGAARGPVGGTELLGDAPFSPQSGEVECSFAPCPVLDCPQQQRQLRPGQCCFSCKDPPRPSGELRCGAPGRGKGAGDASPQGSGFVCVPICGRGSGGLRCPPPQPCPCSHQAASWTTMGSSFPLDRSGLRVIPVSYASARWMRTYSASLLLPVPIPASVPVPSVSPSPLLMPGLLSLLMPDLLNLWDWLQPLSFRHPHLHGLSTPSLLRSKPQFTPSTNAERQIQRVIYNFYLIVHDQAKSHSFTQANIPRVLKYLW